MSERDLFLAALNIENLEDRARFLEQQCGSDAPKLHRLQQLLLAKSAAGCFMESPGPGFSPAEQTNTFGDPSARASNHPRPQVNADSKIIAGRYKLLQQIGEGGMGSVWMADQTEPVKRKVAVKLIRVERGQSKTILARFEAERQAIALMDHPHIAKLLDAGTTEAGSPYFVMELVKGIPLNEYCDKHKLTIPERLNLFAQICSAVQHAHQKGIIHRDLKPSNILVESHDGKPVPKVIDFGLAKATTGLQLSEQSLFTAFGSVMGTPLYMAPEQATFNAVDVDTRADIYALGVILYELLTGTTPITRETLKKAALDEMLKLIREQEAPTPSSRLSSAESTPGVAASRQIEPAKLGRFVRGELDWIVLKALSKDRDRRYETANGFAKDIERFLNHEPVNAGPPSAIYRFKKFVRRNRGQVFAASLVLLALVGGIIGTTLGLLEANRQTVIALEEGKAKEIALRNEAEQRELAEEANKQAFDALKSYTDDYMGKLLGSKERLTETEYGILQNAQRQWEVFARSKGQSQQVRVIQAEGAAELALIQFQLGLHEAAEANDRKALDLRASLAADFPAVPLYRKKQGMSHQNLGASLRGRGKRGEAEVQFGRAVEVYAQLVNEFPDLPDYRARLASSHISLGNSLRDRGDLAKAEENYKEALKHQQKLVDAFPEVTGYRFSVAETHWGLALTKKRLGQYPEAEAHYRVVLATKIDLATRQPASIELRRDIGALHRELGVMISDRGDDAKGEIEFPLALEQQDRLVAEFPSVPLYRSDKGRTHRDYGRVLGFLNKTAAAKDQFAKAEAMFENLVAMHPTVLPYQADLGLAYRFHGEACPSAEGLGWYDKSIQVLTPIHLTDPKQQLTKNSLANSHSARADALDELKRHPEATKDWDKAIALAPLEKLPQIRARRANSMLRAGKIEDALTAVEELTTEANWNSTQWYNFACLYALASGKVDQKKTVYADRAMELLTKAVKLGYKDAAHLRVDPDLDTLRQRKDFQKMLGEVEGVPPPKPKP